MTIDTTSADALARPVAAPGPRRGIGLGELRLDGGFWGRMQETNANATLAHCHHWMDRLGWLANFDRVATGTTGGPRPGWQFSDSEVYKLLEAIAWHLGYARDPVAEQLWDELVETIAAAQDEDGYLNTCFGHTGQRERYSDLSEGHELYCTGHLLQAAVARVRTRGEDRLVEVARRAADHVCREFGAGGRPGICGHPEIEVGLVELGRALDEPRYVEQARLFLERRGHGSLEPVALLGPTYFQDDVPVREADSWRGHAVRALYLAAGAVDVATSTGDGALLHAVEQQWTRSVERRTYLTGGMGSRHQDEGFGEDWELPADRAYCETCAGVGSVMVAWRLLLETGDVRYADLIERTLFNVVATSPRSDGRAFFYANPLHQREPGGDVRPDEVNPRAEGGVRAPWFDVSCCPTNVARTLASLQAYTAFVEELDAGEHEADGSGAGARVTFAQYAAGDATIALPDGSALGIRIDTAYPNDGVVRLIFTEPADGSVSLRLRVPHWAEGATMTRSETDSPAATRAVEPGWIDMSGPFAAGERVVLDLPTPPRLTWPDPRVDAVRGAVAVERGPLVLCLESVDLPPEISLDEIRLDASVPPTAHEDGAVVRVRRINPPQVPGGRPPFASGPAAPPPDPGDAFDVALVPYHRWAERGPSAMRVFVPTAPIDPAPHPIEETA